MWVGARAIPGFGIGWPQREIVAMGVAAVGAVIAVLGIVAFRRAKTSVNPLHPEKMSALVSGGVYRFTRNPMYLGLLLTLVGWAIGLGDFIPWLLLPGFIVYINRFQIGPEERALAAMFGAEFVLYRTRVRRWV